MAVLAYPYVVRDQANSTTNNLVTGLTPTVGDGKTLAPSPVLVAASGNVTFVEVGFGLYLFFYDAEAHGDAGFPVTWGGALGNPNDEFGVLILTRDSGRMLNAGATAFFSGTLAAGSSATVLKFDPAALCSDGVALGSRDLTGFTAVVGGEGARITGYNPSTHATTGLQFDPGSAAQQFTGTITPDTTAVQVFHPAGPPPVSASIQAGGLALAAFATDAANLFARLDATVSSRLPTSSYAAPPSAAAVATAVWTDTTAGDFEAAGSPGRMILAQLGGMFVGTGSVIAGAALVNAPSGGGGGSGATPFFAGVLAAGSTATLLKFDATALCADGVALGSRNLAGFLAVVNGESARITGYNTSTHAATGLQFDSASASQQFVGTVTPGATAVQVFHSAALPPVQLDVSQANFPLRLMDAVADDAVTLGDVISAVAVMAYGRGNLDGSTNHYVRKTINGFVVRTYTVDSVTAPTVLT